jgi:hypothetical protein
MSDVVDVMAATVRLEQLIGGGQSTVGTGFVVVAEAPDGAPRTILITAHHVFANMPNDKAKVGFRAQDPEGDWRYAPVNVRIRDAEGEPLWTRHPTQDVAAIELPEGVTTAALPAAQLPGERALEILGVQPGTEMMTLGFPYGLSANTAGFPILRSGRVASYPLSPADRYPTYLVDFDVFGGNSGGPVYALAPGSARATPQVVITGLLTQQIKLDEQRLSIGNVTQADFITETISLMGHVGPTEVATAEGVLPRIEPAPASGLPAPSAQARLQEAWRTVVEDVSILLRRLWIVLRDGFLALITPEARRM